MESMAQSIYNIGGTPFEFDPDTDVSTDFITVTQGVAITLSSTVLEGYGKPLRRGISAFFHATARLVVGSAGTGGQPIVLDLAPLLSNEEGSVGGIPCGTGCVYPASAVVGGAAVPGAQWAAMGNASSNFKLVDHTGTAVTTALANNDRLGFAISGVAVDD